MKLFKLPVLKHWSYLADFIVIVLGIVVALSLDSWWQNKQDRKLEQEYLVRLYNDFKITLKEVSKDFEIQKQSNYDIKKIFKAIHKEVKINNDSVRKWMINGGRGVTINIADGTYQSLINSGNLGLITNDSLNSKLASYGSLVNSGRVKADNHSLLSRQLNQSSLFLENIGVYSLYSEHIRQSRNLPLENKFSIDFSKLINEQWFNSYISEIYVFKRNIVLVLSRLRNVTEEILELLKSELGIEKPKE